MFRYVSRVPRPARIFNKILFGVASDETETHFDWVPFSGQLTEILKTHCGQMSRSRVFFMAAKFPPRLDGINVNLPRDYLLWMWSKTQCLRLRPTNLHPHSSNELLSAGIPVPPAASRIQSNHLQFQLIAN